jgi:hypothetical protein
MVFARFAFCVFRRLEITSSTKGETMNNLRKLLCAFALTFALTLTCLAQTKGCNPGETPTGPPCSAAQTSTEDSTQTDTSTAAESVDVVSVAETALAAMLIF